MILHALTQFYDRKSKEPDCHLPLVGFSVEKIHFSLVLNSNGQLVQVLDLRERDGRRTIPRLSIVPKGAKKSVNIAANFLWGSTSYVLGADEKKRPERTADCHEAFKGLHKDLLVNSNDKAAEAVLKFLEMWRPSGAPALDLWQDMLSGNLVFQLDGERGFVHERDKVKAVWEDHFGAKETQDIGACLIDGEYAPIARLHPSIKGVRGAQSSGAAIVSFNLEAFCSYNKTQNYNAPVSEVHTHQYSSALNELLRETGNRISIGDSTTVFWTERESPVEGYFGLILNPSDVAASDNKEIATFLDTIRDGKFPAGVDPDIKFYILGLSPNTSRLSVRFWFVDTVKEISEKLVQHFRNLDIIKSFDSDPDYPGIWQLLQETRNRKSKDGPPPLLAGALMRSILTGGLYPQQLLSAVIGRIRAEHNINYKRAAIIKAVLIRKKRILGQGMEVPMALDRENKNVAYLLGRLFAVLEKAQMDAVPGANATIKDRFYGSASATPRVVFPQLLRLSQHHIAKAEYGRIRDRQIQEIVSDIKEFPAHLGLDHQGMFAIGYYHQRQDIYTKKEKIELEKQKES